MYNWDLEKIYNGFDSKEFKADVAKAEELVKEMLSYDVSKRESIEVFKGLFKLEESFNEVLSNLYIYAELRTAVNSEDLDALKAIGKLQTIMISASPAGVKFQGYIKDYPNVLEDSLKDDYLKTYKYSIEKSVDDAKRMLSDETEIMLSKLERSSGSAWSALYDSLTSTLKVDYRGKEIGLSEVRNLAYSEDEQERKDAYDAELKSYKKIDKSVAACLSSIKEEVETISSSRGFKSPLDSTLNQTGMTKKTLDALVGAIEESYPMFRTYLKRKGEILGHKNGLPFYDLFAPLGKSDTKFTVEEANAYLVEHFTKFNPEIGAMMEKAMENNWIDYMPKMGKAGGAFCTPVFKLKESRILTNFDGTFGSVDTLAHELGHAFHNEVMWDKPMLLSDYPMQLAETASTFNETFLMDDAIKNAKDKEEKINLLEATIQGDNQVMVDIMSRYYFETSVFEKSRDAALTPEELCELMKDAQLRSYGDGLDKEYLHPYMWCCKSHYYSTGLSFYNFPYAFGQLFAYGLYAIYEEKGSSFFPLYKKVLENAGQMPIKECALLAGVDVEDKAFWLQSLKVVESRIDEFMELTK